MIKKFENYIQDDLNKLAIVLILHITVANIKRLIN